MNENEKIGNFVQETLELKALNEEQLQGTNELKHYLAIVKERNEGLWLCIDNELTQCFYDIARIYYNKGFKDAKNLVKECLRD